jgi:hypothetical protein
MVFPAGSELGSFIQETLKQIKGGVGSGFQFSNEPIMFDLKVTDAENQTGGADIKVLRGEIDSTKIATQRITFSVFPADSSEAMKERSSRKWYGSHGAP